MDVTTMGSTNLLPAIKRAYPDIHFKEGDDYRWSASEQAVYFMPLKNERDHITLFHEIGHAIAQHQSYDRDIELLRLEREAWTIAAEKIAPQFAIMIDDGLIEEALDSYRDWLHARSLCPECSQNGIQKSPNTYHCLLCDTSWRVNDARQCGLKRYRLDTTKTPA